MMKIAFGLIIMLLVIPVALAQNININPIRQDLGTHSIDIPNKSPSEDAPKVKSKVKKGGGCITNGWYYNKEINEWKPQPAYHPLYHDRIIHACIPFSMSSHKKLVKPKFSPFDPDGHPIKAVPLNWWRPENKDMW